MFFPFFLFFFSALRLALDLFTLIYLRYKYDKFGRLKELQSRKLINPLISNYFIIWNNYKEDGRINSKSFRVIRFLPRYLKGRWKLIRFISNLFRSSRKEKKGKRKENNLLPAFPTEDLFFLPEKKNNYSFGMLCNNNTRW